MIFSSEQLPLAEDSEKRRLTSDKNSFQEFREALFEKEELPLPDPVKQPKESNSFSELVSALFSSEKLPDPEKKEETKRNTATEYQEANDRLTKSKDDHGKKEKK